MEEDWGLTANAPKFTIFKDVSPEDEAKKDTFVDIVVYNRWTKPQRRLYQRLKAERIAKQVEEQKIETMDDLSNALESLTFLKSNAGQDDALIDDLIGQLETLKVRNFSTEHIREQKRNY